MNYAYHYVMECAWRSSTRSSYTCTALCIYIYYLVMYQSWGINMRMFSAQVNHIAYTTIAKSINKNWYKSQNPQRKSAHCGKLFPFTYLWIFNENWYDMYRKILTPGLLSALYNFSVYFLPIQMRTTHTIWIHTLKTYTEMIRSVQKKGLKIDSQ